MTVRGGVVRNLLWLVYAVFWVGGVINRGASPALNTAAPLFLVLAGVITFLDRPRRDRPFLFAAAVIGFCFEVIGVRFGTPFGSYRYTEALSPSVLRVPIAIAFAWAILIDFASALFGRWWAAALLMAAIDLVIDPVASGPLAYWKWLEPGAWYGVPLENFAGWLVVSALILGLLPAPGLPRRSVPLAGWSVVVFFAVLCFEYGLRIPAVIGCALAAIPIASGTRARSFVNKHCPGAYIRANRPRRAG